MAADNLEYDQNCGKITATENVVLIWQEKKIKADYAEFLIEEKVMNASGHVRVEENGNSFFAENITYNYDDETGEIINSMANSSVIFMRSEKMERQGKNSFAINRIKLSSCDLDEPHVYFKSKKGKLVLNKRVTIYNAVLYVGKVPVFYLPVVTKSLKGGKGSPSPRLTYGLEPGYTSDGGLSVKTFVAYQFNDSFDGKTMLDYYGTRGWGYGTEFNYYSNNAKGSLYAYNINDLSSGYERWTVRPYYWQRINSKWTLQSQAELISDRSFNNYYNNDWNRVMNTLHSYAALTRQGANTNLMMAFDKVDVYDSATGDYSTRTMSVPKVNFTVYPKKIIWNIVNNFTLNYTNDYRQYSTDNFFYKNIADANYSITRDFRFGRKFTLKPTLGIIENWYDKDNEGEEDSTFITRYYASLNSRLRVNRWMDWNLAYNVRSRTKENSLEVDYSANDYGIETNALSFTNYMYIGNRTTVRNFVTYNFMLNRDPVANDNLTHWSPLGTEIIYTPKYYMTVYLKQTQSLEPFLFKSLQLDVTLGELEKIYFNVGAFYQYYDKSSSPDMAYRSSEIDNTFGIGLWVTPKWRLDYNIRLTSKTDKIYSRMNEHEFKLYRDLHCYNFGVTWKIREIYHELYFKFDMKTNMPFTRTSEQEQSESQYKEEEAIFYPWR